MLKSVQIYNQKGDEKEWPIGWLVRYEGYACIRMAASVVICYQYCSASLEFQVEQTHMWKCRCEREQSRSSPIYVIAFLWISKALKRAAKRNLLLISCHHSDAVFDVENSAWFMHFVPHKGLAVIFCVAATAHPCERGDHHHRYSHSY